jgi:hypothetical protein
LCKRRLTLQVRVDQCHPFLDGAKNVFLCIANKKMYCKQTNFSLLELSSVLTISHVRFQTRALNRRSANRRVDTAYILDILGGLSIILYLGLPKSKMASNNERRASTRRYLFNRLVEYASNSQLGTEMLHNR